MSNVLRCYWLTLKSFVVPFCDWKAIKVIIAGIMHVVLTLATSPLIVLPSYCLTLAFPPPYDPAEGGDFVLVGVVVLFIASLILWILGVVNFWCRYDDIINNNYKGPL